MAAPFKNLSVVSKIVFGRGSFGRLPEILSNSPGGDGPKVFLVDDVFRDGPLAARVPARDRDRLIWVNVDKEPGVLRCALCRYVDRP